MAHAVSDGSDGAGFAFLKVEGLGNDFVLLRGEAARRFSPEQAPWWCDRRRGVGADGVLLLLPPRSPAALGTMVLFNADGSEAEMCGNGLRCVAHALVESGEQALWIDTGAGPRHCVAKVQGARAEVRVDMGEVSWLDAFALELDGRSWSWQQLSAGNPHVVTFDPAEAHERQRVGPALERDPRFPQRTNVSFARVLGPEALEVVVWERGAGFTDACGTAACASAQAAWRSGRLHGEAVTVHLPGGPLRVERGPGDVLWMTGPARQVYRGRWPA